jgi:hypothetical protein
MKPLRCLCALLFPLTFAFAEKDADLKPASVKAGKVTAEDTFSSAELAKAWSVNKGDWQVKGGSLAGAIKASDHHPAVLMLGVSNHDSIIKFSFKVDGDKGFNLSYNSGRGHLFRVIVTGDGLSVVRDKDKKDKSSKPTTLATASGKITSGEWHTMLVEVKGNKVHVQTDTGLKAEGTHLDLDVDKSGYRFVTGASLEIDDVKVWAVE